jgi:hypothetical protein
MADHPSPVAAELHEARDLCILSEPEQLELIRDAVPGRDAATAVAVAERRGRGRPRNSLNKRNQKFRDQLLAIGGHPALALVRAYSTPVETLAAQLGCSKLEAAQLGIRAAAELLPYVEGKQPVQVDVRQRSDVVLVMASGAEIDGGELQRIADEATHGMAEGVDWESAEIVDVLPSLSGEPKQDVSPTPTE